MAVSERSNVNLPVRGLFAFGAVVSVFFLIALRLWYLQILNGDYFRDRSENNRLRTVFVPPPRGLILDREGRVLVKNRPSFNVELVTEDSPNPRETIRALAEITGYDARELLDRVRNQKKRRRFEPKLILKDISRDLVAKVSAKRFRLPGVIVNVVPTRNYLYGKLAAHVLGYIREITGSQLDKPTYSGYMLGDVVGQYGVEARWERYLQGKRGIQAVIVDAGGTRIGEASFEPEVAGHNVSLTLDLDVQQAADKALEGKKGAIVALDPNTGEVIAMSSAPAFDPNMFTGEVSGDMWKDLVSGSEKKLSNRALQGAFPPGSVFKVFMSAAGLSEGVINTGGQVNCPGFLNFAGRAYHCWQKRGHGAVDLHEAIVESCDVYFYTVGQRLGIDRIHDYMTRFGLGQTTGLDLVEENPGLIPSTAWKKTFKNPAEQKWWPGETLSVSIGQGAVTVTPFQIARALSALVNGGHLMQPYMVRRIDSNDGLFKDDGFGPKEVSKVDVSQSILDIVKAGMAGVVNEPHGTGHAANLMKEFGVAVGGKTGTAQVAGLQFFNHKKLNDHAWFAGFAPVDKPQIVVVALNENGGHGGSAAAPLVKQVMEAFFEKRMPRLVPKETPTPSGTPTEAQADAARAD